MGKQTIYFLRGIFLFLYSYLLYTCIIILSILQVNLRLSYLQAEFRLSSDDLSSTYAINPRLLIFLVTNRQKSLCCRYQDSYRSNCHNPLAPPNLYDLRAFKKNFYSILIASGKEKIGVKWLLLRNSYVRFVYYTFKKYCFNTYLLPLRSIIIKRENKMVNVYESTNSIPLLVKSNNK